MKKFFWILFLLTGLLACHNNGDRSDAYGNFEATEVMVSALAQGELLSLEPEEGDQLEKGMLVGLVDTTDLWLKQEQLVKSIAAVQTRLVTIKAQMDVQQQQSV